MRGWNPHRVDGEGHEVPVTMRGFLEEYTPLNEQGRPNRIICPDGPLLPRFHLVQSALKLADALTPGVGPSRR